MHIILHDDNKIEMYFACFNSMNKLRVQFKKVTPFALRYKNNIKTRGSLAKKKDNVLAKTKRPEKDIKVSAKVLRKCFVSSLILLWQPKSAQSALSSTVFKI